MTNVLIDRNDMVWVATEDGLYRYDGVKFTAYRHEDGNAHSLAQNFVRMLFEDKDGRLFVGGGGGVQMYDPVSGLFTRPAVLPDGKPFRSNVVEMFQRADGELWLTGSVLS